jgi:uncharacterized protein (DUF2252 family)
MMAAVPPAARFALHAADRTDRKESTMTTASPVVATDTGGLTPAERSRRGKRARTDAPRSSHGEWEPAPTRFDPVELLEQQCASRLPELLPIRYGRMLSSPFAFYRGAAYLTAADLADAPRSGLEVQLCGDAHLSNFGAFAGPDRRLVFNLNDFDETLPGPFEWDVKRLVASFAVAGRERGFGTEQRAPIVREAARSYRRAMRTFCEMGAMELWYARLEAEQILARFGGHAKAKTRKRFEHDLARATSRDSLRAVTKLTHIVDGQLRIISRPPLIVPIEELTHEDEAQRLTNEIRRMIEAYRGSLTRERGRLLQRFRFAHAARKVVGVGSVGMRAWIVLMLGRDEQDPLFLQFKEARASVLEPFLGRSRFGNQGRRVVEGQRLVQTASDVLLGWHRGAGVDGVPRDFYVRQLWDAKGSFDVELMSPAAMKMYADLCGWTLAKAHARSGDAIAIGAYLGSSSSFDDAMTAFAEAYADQNERDYRALRTVVASGRIAAATDA